jgi:hypothetical protein
VNVNFSPALKARLFDDEGLLVPYSIYDSALLAIASDPNGGAAHLVGGGDASLSAGVATWSAAHIDLGGFGYTLAVGASGLISDTSSSFNITTGLPSRLAFGVPPSAVTAGSKIAPAITVRVTDSDGNLVTSDIATQISLTRSGCSGVAVRGGGPIKVSNGIATFPDVVLNSAGTAQLVASALSRSSATSASFVVAPNPDFLFRTGFEGCVP